jgi:hypothetical protein
MNVVELATRFAPEVRLHSKEQHFPSHVLWYLANSCVKFDTKAREDPILLEDASDLEKLVSLSFAFGVETYTSSSLRKTRFYLTPKVDISLGQPRETEQNLVPVYAHVIEEADEIDIQYFFFYSHNGAIVKSLSKAGVHEGDWEHITVRVSKLSFSIIAVYMAAHSNEGRWYTEKASVFGSGRGYSVNETGHPVIWAAVYSHASYP